MAVAFTSCEEGLPEGFSFSFSPKEVTIPAAGGSASVTFNAPAAWVAASNDNGWINFSPGSGEAGDVTIQISIGENPGREARSAVMTVLMPDYDYSETFTITQPAHEPALSISEQLLQLAAAGGTQTITVSSTVDWTASTNEDWISVNPSSGGFGETTVTINVAENQMARAREGSVSFAGGGLGVTLAVNQGAAGASLSLSAREAEFSSAGGSLVLTVNSNADWTAAANAQWAGLSVSQGTAGETRVTISVPANDSTEARSATITFSAGNVSESFVLSQKGRGQTGGITGDIGDWGDGGNAEYGR